MRSFIRESSAERENDLTFRITQPAKTLLLRIALRAVPDVPGHCRELPVEPAQLSRSSD
jgi:hypothetical protein